MTRPFIEPTWLEAIRGTILYYPAALYDTPTIMDVFMDYIDTYWFCDLNYQADLKLPTVLSRKQGFEIVSSVKEGHVGAIGEWRTDEQGEKHNYFDRDTSTWILVGQKHYYLDPSRLHEVYQRADGKKITIVRRRGYGQMGIVKEFRAKTIGVFVHRGDSRGEGGSNVHFLSNRVTRHEPCGMLFDKLSEKLRKTALVITDGSNTRIPWLNRFNWSGGITGEQAYKEHQGQTYTFGAYTWRCVGYLDARYGPTLVWGVTQFRDIEPTVIEDRLQTSRDMTKYSDAWRKAMEEERKVRDKLSRAFELGIKAEFGSVVGEILSKDVMDYYPRSGLETEALVNMRDEDEAQIKTAISNHNVDGGTLLLIRSNATASALLQEAADIQHWAALGLEYCRQVQSGGWPGSEPKWRWMLGNAEEYSRLVIAMKRFLGHL
jgi:hypothetical protein